VNNKRRITARLFCARARLAHALSARTAHHLYARRYHLHRCAAATRVAALFAYATSAVRKRTAARSRSSQHTALVATLFGPPLCVPRALASSHGDRNKQAPNKHGIRGDNQRDNHSYLGRHAQRRGTRVIGALPLITLCAKTDVSSSAGIIKDK